MEYTINLTAGKMAVALDFVKTHKRLGNVMDCLVGLCVIDNELFITKFYEKKQKSDERACVVESLGMTDVELRAPISFRQEEFLKFLELSVKNKNENLEININNDNVYFKSGGCQIGLQVYVHLDETEPLQIIRAQIELQKQIVKLGADAVNAINECVAFVKLNKNAQAILMDKGEIITTNSKHLLIKTLGGDVSFNTCTINKKITKKDVVGVFNNQLFINNVPVTLSNNFNWVKTIENGADYIREKMGIKDGMADTMRVSFNAGALAGLQNLGKCFIFKISGKKMIIENESYDDDNSVSAKLEIPLLENINGSFMFASFIAPLITFFETCKKEIQANEVLTFSFAKQGVLQFEIGNKFFLAMQIYVKEEERVWEVYNTKIDNEKAEVVETKVAVDNTKNDNEKAGAVETQVTIDNTKIDNEKAEVVETESDAIAKEFNLSKRLSKARRKELKRAFKKGKIKLAY